MTTSLSLGTNRSDLVCWVDHWKEPLHKWDILLTRAKTGVK